MKITVVFLCALTLIQIAVGRNLRIVDQKLRLKRQFSLPDINIEETIGGVIDTVSDKITGSKGSTEQPELQSTSTSTSTPTNQTETLPSQPSPQTPGSYRPSPDGRRPPPGGRRPLIGDGERDRLQPPPPTREGPPEPNSNNSTDNQSLIIAVTIPTVGIVVVAIIIAVSVILYKRRKARTHALRNVEQRGNDLDAQNNDQNKGFSEQETLANHNTKPVSNAYVTQDSGEYAYIDSKAMIEEMGKVTRSGPLPHVPEAEQQDVDLPKPPLTPHREGVDDYYSYADAKSMASSYTQEPTEPAEYAGKDDYYADVLQERKESV